MKKCMLALTLISALTLTATACVTTVDNRNSQVTTSVTSSEPADIPRYPDITDGRTIEYLSIEEEGITLRYEWYVDLVNRAARVEVGAAICLITITDIGATFDCDYWSTPINFKVDKIYKKSAYIDLEEFDSTVAIDNAKWIDNGDNSYSVKYMGRKFPITQIGAQYIVVLCDLEGVGPNKLMFREDGKVPERTDPTIKYEMYALTIPLNQNVYTTDSIDEYTELYVNHWFETFRADIWLKERNNKAIEDFYKAGTTTTELVTSTDPNVTQTPGSDDQPMLDYNGEHWFVAAGDSPEQAQTMPVPKGTVVLSEGLKQKLEKLPDDHLFGVAISFASMIPENYLDSLVYEGISASEYLEKALALADTDKEASEEAMAKYYELRDRYYYDLLFSLSYIGYLDDRGGVTLEDCFFYTYLTKDEILHLECDEDESLYVFAPGLLK